MVQGSVWGLFPAVAEAFADATLWGASEKRFCRRCTCHVLRHHMHSVALVFGLADALSGQPGASLPDGVHPGCEAQFDIEALHHRMNLQRCT